jgi:hypothetical protein
MLTVSSIVLVVTTAYDRNQVISIILYSMNGTIVTLVVSFDRGYISGRCL